MFNLLLHHSIADRALVPTLGAVVFSCIMYIIPHLLVQLYEELELERLVYYGGVEPSIRKEVWPFLLGHYTFTMTPEERKEVCTVCVFAVCMYVSLCVCQ